MIRKAISWLVFSIVLGVAWLLLGPARFGGHVHYVTVSGTSMEPTYHDGDLVLARAAPRYEVGDIVTYVVDLNGTEYPVIHRIVEVRPEGYVTRGDNREQADGWIPTDDEILGASWVRVPSAGSAINFVRSPTALGGLAGLAAWLGVLRVIGRSERRRDPEEPEPGEYDQDELDGDGTGAQSAEDRSPVAALFGAGICVALIVAGMAVGTRSFASTLEVDGGILQQFFPTATCAEPCLLPEEDG